MPSCCCATAMRGGSVRCSSADVRRSLRGYGRAILLACIVAYGSAASVAAQTASVAAQSMSVAAQSTSVASVPDVTLVRPPLRFAAEPSDRFEMRQGVPAFLPEFAGAVVGSLAGLGLGLLIARPDECNNEDLACILRGIGVAGLTAFAGAPVGAVLLGNLADSSPSVWGALIGSAAGLAAGAGLVHLADEVDDDALPVLYNLVIFGGTHGLLTALGSRIGAAIRD